MSDLLDISEVEEELFVKFVQEERDYSKPILVVSIILGGLCLIISLLNFLDVVNWTLSPGDGNIRRMIYWLIYAGIVFMGPYPFYKSIKSSRVKAIEKRIPEFLRDVAEAGRFGMTLSEAIVVASTGRYGELTPEIKKMAAQIEWGVPASQAINRFAKRIDTETVYRVAMIIVKSNDAGGNVVDVLSMVAHDAREEQNQIQERKIAMSTYIAVIYISFFVFLATIIILNATFLPQMLTASASMSEEEGGDESGGVQGSPLAANLPEIVNQVQLAFLVAVVVHAIGDGLLAGVLVTGEIMPGFIHASIMLAIGRISYLLTPYIAPALV